MISDTTPPNIICPADKFESVDIVSWNPPLAIDNIVPLPVVVCNPATGSQFAIGSNTVTCTATDEKQNDAQCTFSVLVGKIQMFPVSNIWPKRLDQLLMGRINLWHQDYTLLHCWCTQCLLRRSRRIYMHNRDESCL